MRITLILLIILGMTGPVMAMERCSCEEWPDDPDYWLTDNPFSPTVPSDFHTDVNNNNNDDDERGRSLKKIRVEGEERRANDVPFEMENEAPVFHSEVKDGGNGNNNLDLWQGDNPWKDQLPPLFSELNQDANVRGSNNNNLMERHSEDTTIRSNNVIVEQCGNGNAVEPTNQMPLSEKAENILTKLTTTHQDEPSLVKVSPDGRFLFVSFAKGDAQLIDTTTEQEISFPNNRGGHALNDIHNVIFSPDSTKLFIYHKNCYRCKLLGITKNKILLKNEDIKGSEKCSLDSRIPDDGEYHGAVFSPNSDYLWISLNNSLNRLIHIASNRTLPVPSGFLKTVQFSLDNQTIYLRYNNGKTKLINLDFWRGCKSWKQNNDLPSPLFSELNQDALTERDNNNQKVMEPSSEDTPTFSNDTILKQAEKRNTREPTNQMPLSEKAENILTKLTTTHQEKPSLVKVSPDGRFLFVSFAKGDAQLIDTTTEQEISFPNNRGGCALLNNTHNVIFSPDSTKLFIEYKSSGSCRLIDVMRSTVLLENKDIRGANQRHRIDKKIPDDGEYHGAVFSPNSDYLWISLNKSLNRLIHIASNRTLPVPSGLLKTLQFSPDSKMINLTFKDDSTESVTIDTLTKNNSNNNSEGENYLKKIRVEEEESRAFEQSEKSNTVGPTNQMSLTVTSNNSINQNRSNFEQNDQPFDPVLFPYLSGVNTPIENSIPCSSNNNMDHAQGAQSMYSPDSAYRFDLLSHGINRLIHIASNQEWPIPRNVQSVRFSPDSKIMYIQFCNGTTTSIPL